jgi:hypothetical protein
MGTYGAWEPSGSRCDPLPFIIQGAVPPPPKGGSPLGFACALGRQVFSRKKRKIETTICDISESIIL